jgi:4-hydroxybenzoate polyprenyltransferase
MRLDKPIGTWLLLLPCWWSIALAAKTIPNIGLMILFGIGALVMRGAGCVINDIYDRKLDAAVERTRDRPLASGEIKLWQAILFLGALLVIGLGILHLLNSLTVGLGIASLFLVVTYPLMKRLTFWPQLFLGFTFNWGALMGWAAVTGMIGLPTIPLYIAGIFWTLGYDTIYAYQDRDDDVRVGIKSTARLLGDKPLPWIALFYMLSLIWLGFAGLAAGLGTIFYYGLIVAAIFALVQMSLWRSSDPANCLRRFVANRDFGFIILASIILGKFI